MNLVLAMKALYGLLMDGMVTLENEKIAIITNY